MTAIASKDPNGQYRAVQMVVGVTAGAVISYVFVTALRHFGINLKAMAWIDVMALLQGMVFAALGLIALAITMSPRLAGVQIEQATDAPPASRLELTLGRLQGVVLLLAGLLMLTPLLASELGMSGEQTPLLFAVIVVGYLLQTGVNLAIWQRADELMRAMIARTSAVSFWVLQGALFLAASAQKLGLLREFSLWTAMVITLGIYSVASLAIAKRVRYR
jgi:hypothetical protein